jgi:hypothetical protein
MKSAPDESDALYSRAAALLVSMVQPATQLLHLGHPEVGVLPLQDL